jgi:hypothetical protein
MSKCSAAEAMRDRNAYLISYIRVTEAEYKSRTPASTPLRPVQPTTPSEPRGAQSGYSPVKSGTPANGMRVNGHSNGSPTKRKRDSDDEGTPYKTNKNGSMSVIPPSTPRDSPSSRDHSSPLPRSPLSAIRPGLPKHTYSKSNGHPKFQPKPSDEMYHPEPINPHDRFNSPIQRPRHPSPDDSGASEERLSKKQRKKLNKKLRREEGVVSRGPPMPFAQGRPGGAAGFRGTFGKRGIMQRMQPRPRGILNRE